MRIVWLSKVAILGIATLLVVGCADPPVAEPSKDFTTWLQSYGQAFTPEPAPAGTADWHAGIGAFPPPGAKVDSAIYGVVRCIDPAKNCANRGLARPGQLVPIWIVTFVETVAATGCPVWATVDPQTGAFMSGMEPPC